MVVADTLSRTAQPVQPMLTEIDNEDLPAHVYLILDNLPICENEIGGSTNENWKI